MSRVEPEKLLRTAGAALVTLDETMLPRASVTVVVVEPFALGVTLVVTAALAGGAPAAGLAGAGAGARLPRAVLPPLLMAPMLMGVLRCDGAGSVAGVDEGLVNALLRVGGGTRAAVAAFAGAGGAVEKAAMTLAERLAAADAWLLDRVFQPLSDRLDGSTSAFDVGLSLQLGAVVLELASDAALYLAGMLGVTNGVYDGFSIACGMWFYVYVARLRAMVAPGRLNPLRPMFQVLRLLGLGFAAWSVFSSATSEADAALAYGLTAASNLAFVAGMYLVSCRRPPPGERRRVWAGFRREAPSLG